MRTSRHLPLKLVLALSLVLLFTAALLAVPTLRPFWKNYQAVVRDCVDTKPVQRTKAQQDNCTLRAPAGFVIPGVL